MRTTICNRPASKRRGIFFAADRGDSYLPTPAEFAGSNACQGCHAVQFEGGTKSLHNKPTKYLANQGEGILVNDAVGTPAGNDFVETFDFNRGDFQTAYGYANPFANQIPNAPILMNVGSDYIIQIGATQYKINSTQGATATGNSASTPRSTAATTSSRSSSTRSASATPHTTCSTGMRPLPPTPRASARLTAAPSFSQPSRRPTLPAATAPHPPPGRTAAQVATSPV